MSYDNVSQNHVKNYTGFWMLQSIVGSFHPCLTNPEAREQPVHCLCSCLVMLYNSKRVHTKDRISFCTKKKHTHTHTWYQCHTHWRFMCGSFDKAPVKCLHLPCPNVPDTHMQKRCWTWCILHVTLHLRCAIDRLSDVCTPAIPCGGYAEYNDTWLHIWYCHSLLYSVTG